MSVEKSRRTCRPPLRLLIPALIALLAAVAVVLYPHADEPGSFRTGPIGLAHLPRVVSPFDPSVSWGPGRRSIVLTVHPKRACRVRLGSITSTAPGRIEVHAISVGSSCVGPSHVFRFRLPLPTLPDPHKDVRVQIGSEALRLPWYRRPPAHPPGSYI